MQKPVKVPESILGRERAVYKPPDLVDANKDVTPVYGAPPGPQCGYCGAGSTLYTTDRVFGWNDRADALVYVCDNWPACDAYVRCREDGVTMGTLANKELRAARQAVHAVFDPLWKDGPLSRSLAYFLLSRAMNIRYRECHFGRMDLETCHRAVQAVPTLWEWIRAAEVMAGEYQTLKPHVARAWLLRTRLEQVMFAAEVMSRGKKVKRKPRGGRSSTLMKPEKLIVKLQNVERALLLSLDLLQKDSLPRRRDREPILEELREAVKTVAALCKEEMSKQEGIDARVAAQNS